MGELTLLGLIQRDKMHLQAEEKGISEKISTINIFPLQMWVF